MAIRCNTPNIRTPLLLSVMFTQLMKLRPSSVHLKKGHQFRKRPIRNINTVRFAIFFQKITFPATSRRGNTKDIALPTANKKKGKTKSVGVRPCQGACSSGE